MKIVADKRLCSGHARCASVAPELFTLNDEGYINFDTQAVPPDLAALARRGVMACPERALKLVEDDAAA